MKAAALLFLLAIFLSPIGNARSVQVTVVPVRAVEPFEAWLGMPTPDPARAAKADSYPARVARLPFGKKTLLPIVVTGLPVPAPQTMHLVASVEIIGADGRTLATSPRCCRATIEAGSKASAVLLDSWALVEPVGSGQGLYTVRASVTDGANVWTTNEIVPYGEPGATAPLALPGSSHEAPRLRMNVPPSQLEAGGPGDRRDCLALPSPAEVIRCAEKGRR